MIFQQFIELKLKAFESQILDKSSKDIVRSIFSIGARYKGPIPIPCKLDRFIVNRSPHVDKKSREQFEIKEHVRLLIIEASSHTVDILMKLDISAGVDITIKMSSFSK